MPIALDTPPRVFADPIAAELGAQLAMRIDFGSEDAPRAGYGSCTWCSCPGFSGSGWTCGRGGCGHHYSTHW